MTVYLAGTGCGSGTLTAEVQTVLKRVCVIAGPERLLRAAEDTWKQEDAAVSGSGAGQGPEEVLPKTVCAVYPQEILEAVREAERLEGDICVLMSGDSGFFSGTRRLLPMLEEREVCVLPGISSLQVLAARCGRPWQEWRLCSAHGVDCDPVREVCKGSPVFFLTGGKQGPAELCAQLAEAGLEDLAVVVGEDLGTEKESIRKGTAAAFAKTVFSPLSVMLAEAAPVNARRTPGFPDELFQRTEKVPMTKQAVRAVILSLLDPGEDEVCWDVGAGTGSVSIELAAQAGAVYGIEKNTEALTLAEKNRRALGAWNLRLIEGTAPEALRDLPAPDVVFVGGSSGSLEEILQLIHEKNPKAKVCVSAIVLENAAAAAFILGKLGYKTEILQVGISRSRQLGEKHMMTAQNPVMLVAGKAE